MILFKVISLKKEMVRLDNSFLTKTLRDTRDNFYTWNENRLPEC